MIRRERISGRQPVGCQPPCTLIQSSIKRAGIGARDCGVGGAQVPQPDEAKQRHGPLIGWRRHFKGRSAVADHDFAGEGKTSGVDFAGARGVRGAQVLWRDHQAVGLGRGKSPAQQRMRVEPAKKAAKCAAPDEHGEPGSLRDRNPHRQVARPLSRAPIRTRGPHDSEGSGKGQYADPEPPIRPLFG